MPHSAERGTRRRGRLSRGRVVRAAVGLADKRGLDAVTMRSIAQGLGVEAMSLYRHVESKEDLLDGMVDLMYGEIDIPSDAGGWQAAMRHRAISAREVLSRHRWAIGLMESRMRPGPDSLRHRETVLAVLLGAGFTSASATHAYNLLDSYIYGFALQEATLPITSAEELAEAGETIMRQISAEDYPHLTRVASELLASGFDYADEFEFGLGLILEGLERMRQERS